MLPYVGIYKNETAEQLSKESVQDQTPNLVLQRIDTYGMNYFFMSGQVINTNIIINFGFLIFSM